MRYRKRKQGKKGMKEETESRTMAGTMTIKGRRDGRKTEEERKTQRQMWVNETDNGKQWCMAWMIVFQDPCQIEQRT